MAIATKIAPPPAPVPPTKVVLELSEAEAQAVYDLVNLNSIDGVHNNTNMRLALAMHHDVKLAIYRALSAVGFRSVAY